MTRRIKLATTILIAPYRVNAALLAKESASVHKISGGGREDDYSASGVDFESRGGENFERMLEQAGCDELILFPSSSDPEQVDLLAEAAL